MTPPPITATIYWIRHVAKPGDFYIGKTTRPFAARVAAHRRASGSAGRRLQNWWRARVRETGIEPTIDVLEQVACGTKTAAENWCREREVVCIAAARQAAAQAGSRVRCLNSTAGGDGCVEPTADTRKRMSAANRGRKHSTETRAKLSAANRGKTVSDETRAKLSAANRGKKHSPEHRARISDAQRGKKHSPEARARRSDASRDRSPETRAKMSAAHRGKKHSPETRAKMSAAHRNMSPETRAKIIAAQRSAAARRANAAGSILTGQDPQ